MVNNLVRVEPNISRIHKWSLNDKAMVVMAPW